MDWCNFEWVVGASRYNPVESERLINEKMRDDSEEAECEDALHALSTVEWSAGDFFCCERRNTKIGQHSQACIRYNGSLIIANYCHDLLVHRCKLTDEELKSYKLNHLGSAGRLRCS